jgi:hypothetical protein
LIVRAAAEGQFQWGAFGEEELTMDSNAFVDSYDSRSGTYDSQEVNGSGGDTYALANGNVGSNGSISLSQNAMVMGSAQPGPGETTTLAGNQAYVDGSTAASEDVVEMPEIEIPVLAHSGSLILGTGDNAILPPGEYDFSEFSLDSSSTLTIQGPAVIVCNNWTLDSNAEVWLDASAGGLEVYVHNDFVLNSNTLIASETFTPSDIRITLESDNVIDPELNVDLDEVDFDSNAQLYGTIYAPNAAVDINSNFELFGSLIARSVHLDSNSRIHFDEALQFADTEYGDEYEMVCWRVRSATSHDD